MEPKYMQMWVNQYALNSPDSLQHMLGLFEYILANQPQAWALLQIAPSFIKFKDTLKKDDYDDDHWYYTKCSNAQGREGSFVTNEHELLAST